MVAGSSKVEAQIFHADSEGKQIRLLARSDFDPATSSKSPGTRAVGEDAAKLLDRFQQSQTKVKKFHDEVQKLQPTPLYELPDLANKLKVSNVLIKDESQRLGLKAFKGVGVAYAVDQVIERMGREKFYAKGADTTICTMTDGNHGRAVARVAKEKGCKCIIYVPHNMVQQRIDVIKAEGAEVKVVDGSYDDAIEEIKKLSESQGHHLISDTAWEGYSDVPSDICAGYGSIFREVSEALQSKQPLGSPKEAKDGADPAAKRQRTERKPITHLVLQAGVGGFASAGAAYVYWNSKKWKGASALNADGNETWSDNLQMVVIEPTDADCVFENAITYNQKVADAKEKQDASAGLDFEALSNSMAQDYTMVMCKGKTDSVMAGLNCGMPSTTAWPILRDLTDHYVAIGDDYARDGVRQIYSEGLVAGECSGGGVGAIMGVRSLRSSITDSGVAKKDTLLGLGTDSVVLFVSTEGDTDTKLFEKYIQDM